MWLFIGDVSGKGVGSSLIMTAAVSLLDQMQGIGGSLNELARDFNSQLFHLIGSNKGSAPGFFITAGCAFLKKEGNLYYAYTVNAGHEPPLLLRENNFTALPSGGRAFGISGDTHYKLFKTELNKEMNWVIFLSLVIFRNQYRNIKANQWKIFVIDCLKSLISLPPMFLKKTIELSLL